jgi:biopolymer transport protein ExbB
VNYQTKQTLMGRGLSGILLAGLLGSTSSWAQESKPIQGIQANPELPGGIESAGQDLLKQLEASLVELTTLRATIAEDLIALGREQSQLEADLSAARSAFRAASSEYDGRSLELANLQNSKKSLESTSSYLGTLLGEYTRNFESRLLLPEQQRYGAQIEAAKLAPQNSNLTEAQVFEAQLALVQASLSRLEESFGGVKFPGQAVDELGRVHAGNFLLVGPVALFGSSDGQQVGTAEEALNSVQPRLFAFADPAKTAEAAELLNRGEGRLVFDPTLGNARKVEATKETLVEHLIAGGPVMVPILALGLVAFLMVLFKWAGLALLGRPSKKRLNALMDAVESGDEQQISAAAKGLRGPIGRMLQAGVENIDKPKELIEESMFEQILQTKLKLNSFLPFIAVSASAAPLMGLLGTVTGIIDTFKMITVVGSGDVKTLSGGISEALITTEYGLIVAIPSLLLHALLNRKVRGIISGMEVQAINLMNQVGKSKLQHDLQPAGKPAPALSPVGAPHPASPVLATPPQPQVLPQQLEALVQAKVREALASQLMAQGAGSLRG